MYIYILYTHNDVCDRFTYHSNVKSTSRFEDGSTWSKKQYHRHGTSINTGHFDIHETDIPQRLDA